ncbi:MAG TPA: L-seryl-tRNA(Sec) selenium transferase [Thermoanaerobaculia bacterium]
MPFAAVAGCGGRLAGVDPRRQIPPIHRLLDAPALGRLIELYGRGPVTIHLRRAVDAWRREVAGDEGDDGPGTGGPAGGEHEVAADLARRAAVTLAAELGRPLARVLNATGILVHTNLGRTPLPAEVARALPPLLDAGCDLEVDLESGRRGDRNRRPQALLAAATGAEAALVVNNNAAATMLALAVHLAAERREVVVSRGELVEIGGSFRIPDVLAAAGASLVEVGTTNRTRLADYAAAIGPRTAVLLKVHPSNFRVVGFTAEVGAAALADLGRRRGVAVVVDEGSGLLAPRREPQLADHDSLSTLVAAGCDLACGSGDKLLGGPQAGLIVGRAGAVERCRRHPLYRALRPDRMTLAALELVLRRHLAGAPAPLDRLWPDAAEHRRRLEAAAERLAAAGVAVEIVPADAFVGGGSAPERPIPGEALALPGAGDDLLARLRTGEPPVVGYLAEGRLVLDLRTVAVEDDPALVAAVGRAVAAAPG